MISVDQSSAQRGSARPRRMASAIRPVCVESTVDDEE